MQEEFFEELKIYASQKRVPIIRDKSALFLQEQIKELCPKEILEIGTAIGYSACLMLSCCESAKITTVELKETSYNKALENFKKAGIENQVETFNCDALEFLQSISTSEKKYDFIFLDGPKGQYYKYLPYCKNLLNQKGVIFADNIFLQGLTYSKEPIKHKHRAMVNNMRKFVDMIENDEDLQTNIYDIEDGIAIIKKK